MSIIQLPANGWKPREHQMGAWGAMQNPDIRTHILAWHRRAGKDEVALHHAAIKAMQRVGNYWHMLPQQEQARKAIWDAVNPHTGKVRWKDAFPEEIIQHVDNQSMKLTFVNGSTWQLVGSDNYDSLVGTTPVGMTLSEAALADPAAFAFFRPILLENKGWSVHISSVRGKNHFYNQFLSAQNNPRAFAQHLSALDTGIFSEEDLMEERRDYINDYGSALGNSLFEQEYLSLWDSATIGAVFGKEIRDLREAGRDVPLVYDPRYPVHTSWDLGVADDTVILFWQDVGNTARLIDWYSASDTGLEHYAEILRSKPYHYSHHIGPHDIAVREWGTGISRMAQAKALGIHFERVPNTPKGDAIAAGAALLARTYVNVQEGVEDPEEDCEFILNALAEYRFAFNKTTKIMSRNPVHDWTSHYADAFMQKALYDMGTSHAPRRQNRLQGRGASDLQSVRLRDLMPRRGRRGAFS